MIGNLGKLSLLGGEPAIRNPLPTIANRTGRDLGEEEMALVREVIESGALSFLYGTMVKRFETEFAERFGVPIAVAVSSGTAAIHTAMVYLDIGPGDEVIVPAITDMGSVIPVLLQNGIPVFVDVDPETYTIDVEDLRRKITDRTRAVVAVHLFGFPCDLDAIFAAIRSINDEVVVIEDCAQALLTEYKGRLVGTIGELGCFSFQQSKHITTGDGGMVIAKEDGKFGRKLRLCADKGWPRETYRDHLFLAPAYHMTELQAAVGIAQLRKANKLVDARIRAAKELSAELSDLGDSIKLPPERPWARNTYHLFVIRIEPTAFRASTEEICMALQAEGLDAKPGYLPQPLYRYPMLRDRITYGKTGCPFTCPHAREGSDHKYSNCPNAEKVCRETIVLPWNEFYTSENIEQISLALHKVLEYYRV